MLISMQNEIAHNHKTNMNNNVAEITVIRCVTCISLKWEKIKMKGGGHFEFRSDTYGCLSCGDSI